MSMAPTSTLPTSREALKRYEDLRARAVALGFRTRKGHMPKPLDQSTPVEKVMARVAVLAAWLNGTNSDTRTGKSAPSCEENTERVEHPPAQDAPVAPPGKGPRYRIPKGTKARHCTSCGQEIWFVRSEGTGSLVPVTRDGYSHFTNCPHASTHSKKSSAKKAGATT